MKKLSFAILSGVLAAGMLVACGTKTGSSSSVASQVSSAVSDASTSAASSSGSASTDTSALDTMLDSLSSAAGFSGTVNFDITSLTQGGKVSADNIASLVGAKSNMYNSDGGLVVIVEAKEGKADTVKTELEAFSKDEIKFLEQYPEFADGVAHAKEARISANGNYVIYASSASGDYDALDAAIAGLF